MVKRAGSIHLIGIAGSGMNGLAQLAVHAGWSVSGSDRACGSGILAALEQLGIRMIAQDGSGLSPSTDLAVVSSAIEPDNADLVRARELGIPVLHRAEMLARLCEGRELIAVAGTAGKSTVTGLLGWIFECLGLDPTVYCGAAVLNWRQPGRQLGTVRFGTGPWILEADESDRSFLAFHPDHAIITNIAEDHLGLAELHRLFAQFKAQVRGRVIEGEAVADAPVSQPDLIQTSLIGHHNRQNIRTALALCRALDLDAERCLHAVASFQGIERRLETVGPRVIDDFAHSPVKIAAALDAVSGRWSRFSACWRPHGYRPLAAGRLGLTEVFAAHWRTRPHDRLFILPVYDAGGTTDRSFTSVDFIAELNRSGIPAHAAGSYDELMQRLLDAGDPVLVMGARDPELPLFARRLSREFANR